MAPLLWKGSTHKISVLQEKQQGGSTLHVTNILTGRMSPTYLRYPWRWSCHLPTYHTGTWVEWFATRNSVWLKVAAHFYKTWTACSLRWADTVNTCPSTAVEIWAMRNRAKNQEDRPSTAVELDWQLDSSKGMRSNQSSTTNVPPHNSKYS